MSDSMEIPLPPHLYRFRTYGAPHAQGKDKDTVFDLLAGRIRFARLQDFNDPFEGRPRAVPAFKDAGKQRSAVQRYIYMIHREHGFPPKEARRKAEEAIHQKSQAELVDWMGERLIETNSADGLYLCCLSGPDAMGNPLTWSHYADHHRGVAIHFDTTLPPFRFALPVEYSQTYPESVVPRIYQDPLEHMKRSFLTKSHWWSYECEFRIIKVDWWASQRDPRATSLLVQWKDTTAITSPEAVVGITLGARMPARERAELTAKIRAYFPGIEIWHASLHRSRYEIVADRVT